MKLCFLICVPEEDTLYKLAKIWEEQEWFGPQFTTVRYFSKKFDLCALISCTYKNLVA